MSYSELLDSDKTLEIYVKSTIYGNNLNNQFCLLNKLAEKLPDAHIQRVLNEQTGNLKVNLDKDLNSYMDNQYRKNSCIEEFYNTVSRDEFKQLPYYRDLIENDLERSRKAYFDNKNDLQNHLKRIKELESKIHNEKNVKLYLQCTKLKSAAMNYPEYWEKLYTESGSEKVKKSVEECGGPDFWSTYDMEYQKDFRELERLSEAYENKYEELESAKNSYYKKLIKSNSVFELPTEEEIKKVILDEELILSEFCENKEFCKGLNNNFKSDIESADFSEINKYISINDFIVKDIYQKISGKKRRDLQSLAKEYNKMFLSANSNKGITIKLNPIKIPTPADIGRELGGVLDSAGNVIDASGKIITNIVKETTKAAKDLVEGTGRELNKLKLFVEENGKKFNYWVNHNVGNDLDNIFDEIGIGASSLARWMFCGGKQPRKDYKDPNTGEQYYKDKGCLKGSVKVRGDGRVEVGNENGEFGGIPTQYKTEITDEQLQWMREQDQYDLSDDEDFSNSLEDWIKDEKNARVIFSTLERNKSDISELLKKVDNNTATKEDLKQLNIKSEQQKNLYKLIKLGANAAADQTIETIKGAFNIVQTYEEISALFDLLGEKSSEELIDDIGDAITEYWEDFKSGSEEEKAEVIGRITSDVALALVPGGTILKLGKKVASTAAASSKLNKTTHTLLGTLSELGLKTKEQIKEFSYAAQTIVSNQVGSIGNISDVSSSLKSGKGLYSNAGSNVSRSSIPQNQTQNLRRFERKVPAGNTGTRIIDTGSGNVVFSSEVPGNVPGSKAIYEKHVDSSGKTISYYKTTYDNNGNIVHIKDKLNGGEIDP